MNPEQQMRAHLVALAVQLRQLAERAGFEWALSRLLLNEAEKIDTLLSVIDLLGRVG